MRRLTTLVRPSVAFPPTEAVVVPQKPREQLKFWRELALKKGLSGEELRAIDEEGTCPSQIRSRIAAYRAWAESRP